MQYATSFNALHLSWRLWVFPQDEGGGSMAELGPIQTTVWISLPMVWCSLRIGLFPPLTDQRMPHGSSACMAQARGVRVVRAGRDVPGCPWQVSRGVHTRRRR